MRLRITFSKSGALRYSGHLDLVRIWERSMRRAGIPLAYTQGFHPGPKIQIAAALPLGFSGRAEILDIWIQEAAAEPGVSPQADAPVRRYADLLQPAAPPGLTIVSVEEVEARGPALQTQVTAAEYAVTLLEAGQASGLDRRIEALLSKDSLPRERRGKPYDLRPLILSLECKDFPFGENVPLQSHQQAGVVQIQMCLSTREAATGRPEEVLDELGIPFETTRIERTRLILKHEIE